VRPCRRAFCRNTPGCEFAAVSPPSVSPSDSEPTRQGRIGDSALDSECSPVPARSRARGPARDPVVQYFEVDGIVYQSGWSVKSLTVAAVPVSQRRVGATVGSAVAPRHKVVREIYNEQRHATKYADAAQMCDLTSSAVEIESAATQNATIGCCLSK
jgi:hypothetical protein